jgi:pilus assembly protein Flp/PilA
MRYYIHRLVIALRRDEEEGQTLVEYALIIALVSVALVASLNALAGGIDNVFDEIVGKLGGSGGVDT